jgi:hypothetical protein
MCSGKCMNDTTNKSIVTNSTIIAQPFIKMFAKIIRHTIKTNAQVAAKKNRAGKTFGLQRFDRYSDPSRKNISPDSCQPFNYTVLTRDGSETKIVRIFSKRFANSELCATPRTFRWFARTLFTKRVKNEKNLNKSCTRTIGRRWRYIIFFLFSTVFFFFFFKTCA